MIAYMVLSIMLFLLRFINNSIYYNLMCINSVWFSNDSAHKNK